MKLKFVNDQIKEYAEGNFHFKNDGGVIEVDASLGAELLKAKHFIDGEFVAVFEQVDPSAKAASDEPVTAESLAKLSRGVLEQMAKDAGLDGDGYTNKKELAAAIFAAKGE